MARGGDQLQSPSSPTQRRSKETETPKVGMVSIVSVRPADTEDDEAAAVEKRSRRAKGKVVDFENMAKVTKQRLERERGYGHCTRVLARASQESGTMVAVEEERSQSEGGDDEMDDALLIVYPAPVKRKKPSRI